MTKNMIAPELFRPSLDLPDMPYDHLLRRSAERYPDRPAIIYHDLVLTCREVVSMVNSIANGLRNMGLGKGDHICLFTPNRPEYTCKRQGMGTAEMADQLKMLGTEPCDIGWLVGVLLTSATAGAESKPI